MTDQVVSTEERFARYRRQTVYGKIGQAGQLKLSQSTVAICGCGALGTAHANLLVRAGVGRVILIDRDFVDLSNLQRQSLFDEQDVREHMPKAVAAANKLQAINSEIKIVPVVADLSFENIESLVDQADLVLDGTDNFETRFLINDVCCKLGTPWVFGGCLGAEGQSMTIVPGVTACFACLMPEGPPAAGAMPTCDSGGILGTVIQAISSIQVAETIKILSGNRDEVSQNLTVVDLWNLKFRTVNLAKLPMKKTCRVCVEGQFDWLNGQRATVAHVMCGRNSVQLASMTKQAVDLVRLEAQLQSCGEVLRNNYLLRFQKDNFSITIFPDGRAIVTGTEDPVQAKALLTQYIGA